LSVFSVCEGARSNNFGRATQELPKLLVKTHEVAAIHLATGDQIGDRRSGPALYG
jgi:hypothetical protein